LPKLGARLDALGAIVKECRKVRSAMRTELHYLGNSLYLYIDRGMPSDTYTELMVRVIGPVKTLLERHGDIPVDLPCAVNECDGRGTAFAARRAHRDATPRMRLLYERGKESFDRDALFDFDDAWDSYGAELILEEELKRQIADIETLARIHEEEYRAVLAAIRAMPPKDTANAYAASKEAVRESP
jgi:hypothetical protein